jgi:hypothetical protein
MEGYEQKTTPTPEIGEDISRTERKDCVPNSGRKKSLSNTKRFLLRVLYYPRKGIDNNNKIQLFLENTSYVARNA